MRSSWDARRSPGPRAEAGRVEREHGGADPRARARGSRRSGRAPAPSDQQFEELTQRDGGTAPDVVGADARLVEPLASEGHRHVAHVHEVAPGGEVTVPDDRRGEPGFDLGDLLAKAEAASLEAAAARSGSPGGGSSPGSRRGGPLSPKAARRDLRRGVDVRREERRVLRDRDALGIP